MSVSDSDKIAFIGLGNMGSRMARCLVSGGFEVTGYDPAEGAAERAGATPAASPGEAARGARVVLLSLPDSTVVERVVDPELLDVAHDGQIVIDLSTASPASTRRIAGRFAGKGVAYVDAGVSGGVAAAEKGALSIMAGGSEAALEAVADVLKPIAAQTFHMGDSGAGHSTKLLNNFLNAVALAATAEVMVAGRKTGLDLELVLEVLNVSSGVNFATQKRFPSIVKGDYLDGGLTGRLMMKDVVLYIDHVRELGVPSLNAAGPLASFGLANQLGYADVVSNRVVDAIGDVAGGVRVHDAGPDAEARI